MTRGRRPQGTLKGTTSSNDDDKGYVRSDGVAGVGVQEVVPEGGGELGLCSTSGGWTDPASPMHADVIFLLRAVSLSSTHIITDCRLLLRTRTP
jgi:hypothetical protein